MNSAQFREEMITYTQALTLSLKPQIWTFHVVVLLTTAKKWTKFVTFSLPSPLSLLKIPIVFFGGGGRGGREGKRGVLWDFCKKRINNSQRK